MNKGKYFLFFILFLINPKGMYAQDLDFLCDSVVLAVQLESPKRLMDLCPDYKALKAVYDTNDIDQLNYQIGLRQKELEYWTSRDMKNLKKYAGKEHIDLAKLLKSEYVYEVLSNEDGHRYAHVQAKCQHRSQPYILHFVLIELNESWYYGEGLRMEKLVMPKEEVPNYEKIDQERERKAQEREKARLRAIEAQKRQEDSLHKQEETRIKDSVKVAQQVLKLRDKEVKDSLKVVENVKKEREKTVRDSIKAVEKVKKERERFLSDSIKVEQAKQKEIEREIKRVEQEEVKRKKEELQKEKEKEKERKDKERKEKEKKEKEDKERKDKEKEKTGEIKVRPKRTVH